MIKYSAPTSTQGPAVFCTISLPILAGDPWSFPAIPEGDAAWPHLKHRAWRSDNSRQPLTWPLCPSYFFVITIPDTPTRLTPYLCPKHLSQRWWASIPTPAFLVGLIVWMHNCMGITLWQKRYCRKINQFPCIIHAQEGAVSSSPRPIRSLAVDGLPSNSPPKCSNQAMGDTFQQSKVIKLCCQ